MESRRRVGSAAKCDAGIPMSVPALTINKVCLSGLDAIALADQLIRAGEFDIVVAGGMESMTNAPHLLMGQRDRATSTATSRGRTTWRSTGSATPGTAARWASRPSGHDARHGITRAEQDAFAAASHQRAAAAQKNGALRRRDRPGRRSRSARATRW